MSNPRENEKKDSEAGSAKPTGEDRGASVGTDDQDRAEYMDGVAFGD